MIEKLVCNLECENGRINVLVRELIVMFNQIVTAIDNCVQNKKEFITCENAYARESHWPFDKNVKFQIFRQRTTTNMISIHLSEFQ